MEKLLHTEEVIPIKIGFTSQVGICMPPNDEPASWGNYFELIDPQNKENYMGIRVVNFWAENLKLANKRFALNNNVKIRRYSDICLIDDERIPINFYYNKLCFTGNGVPSLDIVRDMYNYLGDPDNEIEKYESPETHYAKKGGIYKDGTVYYKPKKPTDIITNDKPTLGWKVHEEIGIAITNPKDISKLDVN